MKIILQNKIIDSRKVDKKEYIVAVDMGSSNVVVAVGSRAENNTLNIDAISIKPSRGIERAEVENLEQAASSLKVALADVEQQLGIKIMEVYAGISGQHITCNEQPYYIHVSRKDGEIVQEDVERLHESMSKMHIPEGYRLLNIIPQNYIVDDGEERPDPIGTFGQTLGSNFNLIVGENIIISRLERVLERAGVKLKGITINALTAANAVVYPDEKEVGVAVIDIGAGVTDVCVYYDKIVRYIGVIPIGANAINKDIQSIGIMERNIEELKIKYGCAMPKLINEDKTIKITGRPASSFKLVSIKTIAAIVEARLTDIAEYVMEELRMSKYDNRLGAGIVLTGGCAQLREIKELFKQKTKMEVRIAQPNILVSEQSLEKATDSRASAAIGIIYEALASGGATKIEKTQEREGTEAKEGPKVVDQETLDAGRVDGNAARMESEEEESKKSRKERKREERESGEKEPRRGIIDRFRAKFERTFDLDALDGDDDSDPVI